MKRLECVIHGYVQGISYRAFVVGRARRLGLSGFVRNLPDGTVEAIAEGDEASLRGFLGELALEYPYAKVETIDERWGEATGEFKEFLIR